MDHRTNATYAIEDLCLHEEYVHPLQEGVNRVAPKGSYSHLGATPLLDSFLRGSIRFTACRKALTPFTFSDGLRVDRGDWVCIPQRATMLDPPRYRHIQQFDRFRFVRANKSLAMGDGSVDVPELAALPLTDVHVNWPIWALGITAWWVLPLFALIAPGMNTPRLKSDTHESTISPGRFYATTEYSVEDDDGVHPPGIGVLTSGPSSSPVAYVAVECCPSHGDGGGVPNFQP
ncbi:hypothetical protein AbraIFM66951_006752 [Aspergillus brasiliensis]|uniref:Uncharacterized protein n=1 Tax=Aspergillus brasiliensis TaxID=319629 RepID=A0A9W5Z546_9EURO|nr:hypothetical protein AbraCBS73388_005734 [Aspergillus brasiliensis]GKZ51693.1 hypothetical protein AbraIFM66951_006752 [Aspergillus brasiliensis]